MQQSIKGWLYHKNDLIQQSLTKFSGIINLGIIGVYIFTSNAVKFEINSVALEMVINKQSEICHFQYNKSGMNFTTTHALPS